MRIKAIADMKTAFTESEEKIKALREDLAKQQRAVFTKATTEIFNLVPNLKSITWTQYTPYFNDGEPCYFSVNNDMQFLPVVADGRSPYEYEEAEDASEKPFEITPHWKTKVRSDNRISDEQAELLVEFAAFINKNEDLMQTLFGEGCVVLTATKSEVHEYDHD